MKKPPILFFIILFLGLAPLVHAESLFDEKKKDAASSLVIDVENDRPKDTENRKFVQSQPDYVKTKLKEFDEKIAATNQRIEKLEAAVKDLTAKKQ